MHDTLYLIKLGEIYLKSGNRKEFENFLEQQLRMRLHYLQCDFTLQCFPGRWYLECSKESKVAIESILAECPGINGFSECAQCNKNLEEIVAMAQSLAREEYVKGLLSYKVEVRRSDKSFPLDSYETASHVGGLIGQAVPELKVDVHAPDFTLYIEIRQKAFLFANPKPGLRGLPIGSAGKAMLLISGGIDSPVAGFLMAKRGLAMEAIHFHSYPYTSDESKQKVIDICKNLSRFAGKVTLHVFPFTSIQEQIAKNAPARLGSIMTRMAMMEAASKLAYARGANSIITGESLSQVASQTAENIGVIGSVTQLPILRPLIGMDKEDIIAIAGRIGSYEISIRPWNDCCAMFAPKHPILKGLLDQDGRSYHEMGLDADIEKGLAHMERLYFCCSKENSISGTKTLERNKPESLVL